VTDWIYKTKTTKHEVYYSMDSAPAWTVIGTRTHVYFRCGFEVYLNDELQYTMKQLSPLKQLISNIPGVSMFFENPFVISHNNAVYPPSRRRTTLLSMGKWDFFFGEDTYRVSLCPEGDHTLFKNGTPVAVYHHWNYWGGSACFKVEYEDEMQDSPDIIMLFGAFVENYVYMDREGGKYGSR